MLYNLQVFFCQHQKVFQAVLQEEGWPHLDSLLTRCVVKFYLQYHYYSHLWSANRDLYQRLQRRHRKRQKSYRFRLAKQQLFTCISLHDFDVRLRNFTFCWGREHKTTTFFSFFKTFLPSFKILIQLHKNMPTFGELSEMEEARWSLKQREFTFIVSFSLPWPSLLLKFPIVHACNLLRCFGVG